MGKPKKIIPVEEILSNRLIMEIKEQTKSFVSGLNFINKSELYFNLNLGELEILSDAEFTDKDKVRLALIKKIVCKYYGTSFGVIKQRKRDREIVFKRHVLQFFLDQYTKYSLAKIGRITGGYDHSTVLHAKKTVNNLIDTNSTIRNEMRDMDTAIQGALKGKKPE